MSVVNAASRQITTNVNERSVNIPDGVVLTEAIRYAIRTTRTHLGISASYMIFDIEESPIPFSEYFHMPFLSAASSRQISSYLFLRQLHSANPAPFVSALPFSAIEEELSIGKGERGRVNFAIVPPTRLEVKAIIDILSRLEWKFVTVIVTRDENGQKMIQEFTNSAFKLGICVGRTVWMSNIATNYEISRAVEALRQERNATVVVSLVDSTHIRGILQSDLTGLTFISGTNIRASRNEIRFKKHTAKGLLMLQHDDTHDEEFKKYFMELKLAANNYSWFGEFWNEVFKCNIPVELRSTYAKYKKYGKTCTGYEKLSEDIVDMRFALVKPVLSAMRTILCALKQSILAATCIYPPMMAYSTPCGAQIMMNSSHYFDKYGCGLYGTGKFNNQGYIDRRYLVLNYNGTDYTEVGSWHYNDKSKSGALSLSERDIVWNLGNYSRTSCYIQCGRGEVEDRGTDGKICCYKCRACSGLYEIVQNNTCIECNKFEVPDASKKTCLPLPRIYISTNSTPFMALELVVLLGIILTLGIITIFVKYRRSRVIKSTGRHLSFIMMVSVTISLSTTIVFFLKPTVIICSVQKILLGQCLGAFYIPMLLKTVRVYRIFEASRNFIRNPMLVSIRSQMIICLFGVVANLILGVLLAASQPTTVKEEAVESYTKVAVLCNHNPVDAVTHLVPCLLLLTACTYFGYKTRNFPSNFNESFRISITLYISCFLWGVYIPLLYLFQNSKDSVFMTNFITAGLMTILAFVNLIGTFGTTLYKAVGNRQVGPETLVGSSTFSAMLTQSITGATKSYRDIGLDPIEM